MSPTPEKSSLPPLPAHAASYKTPLHIFFEDNLLADASALESGLQSTLPAARFYYSTKTNALPPLLQALLKKGWGLEVVGPKDRDAAISAGAEGGELLLNGPAWSKEGLEEAIFEQGIRNLTLDSICMAELLGSLLGFGKLPYKLRIGIRVHDGNSHFGIHPTQKNLEEILNFLPKRHIESIGFHIHTNPSGSIGNLEEVELDFRQRARRINAATAALEHSNWKDLLGFADLGGGIDSPYVYRLQPAELGEFHNPECANSFRESHFSQRFSLRDAGAAIGRVVAEELGALWKGKSIYFEPGRSICTRALSTLVEVKSIKPNFYPGFEVVLTDGNTAILGPIHRAVHQIYAVEPRSPKLLPTFVYGNLPHSGDWLFQNVSLPPLELGDRLFIAHTGAYFQPLEAPFGHITPKVIRYDRDEVIKN